jgi:hypothetical protein
MTLCVQEHAAHLHVQHSGTTQAAHDLGVISRVYHFKSSPHASMPLDPTGLQLMHHGYAYIMYCTTGVGAAQT